MWAEEFSDLNFDWAVTGKISIFQEIVSKFHIFTKIVIFDCFFNHLLLPYISLWIFKFSLTFRVQTPNMDLMYSTAQNPGAGIPGLSTKSAPLFFTIDCQSLNECALIDKKKKSLNDWCSLLETWGILVRNLIILLFRNTYVTSAPMKPYDLWPSTKTTSQSYTLLKTSSS